MGISYAAHTAENWGRAKLKELGKVILSEEHNSNVTPACRKLMTSHFHYWVNHLCVGIRLVLTPSNVYKQTSMMGQ